MPKFFPSPLTTHHDCKNRGSAVAVAIKSGDRSCKRSAYSKVQPNYDQLRLLINLLGLASSNSGEY